MAGNDTFNFNPTPRSDAVMSFLSWSIYRLAKHNHIQTQFRAEAAEVLGNEDIPTDPMLKKMPVLDRILEEVLRLHPPVPYVDRVALKDDKLPDGTLIKAGDVVTLHLYCLQRFPSYWGRFASGFIPNRFVSSSLPLILAQGGKTQLHGSTLCSFSLILRDLKSALEKRWGTQQPKWCFQCWSGGSPSS
jgi:cytochrome P450